MSNSEKFSLKDHLFHKEKIVYLAWLISQNYSVFQTQYFIDEIMLDLEKLELKERIIFIWEKIEKYLPKDFISAVEILKKSLPEAPDLTKTDDDFWDFIFAPYGFFVAKNGCNDTYLDYSLETLAYFTQFFSSEWPIRKFFNTFPQETFEFFRKQAKSKNYHIRRWVSEGSRPGLPWWEKINFDYTKAVTLLDDLFYDTTRYITRSVANHLNDISKKDPELVYETLQKWRNSGKQNSQEMDFIIKHSLRTLVKKAEPQALEMIGVSQDPQVEKLTFWLHNKKIILWEKLTWYFELYSKKEQKLKIDYIIHFKTQKWVWKKVFYLFHKEVWREHIILSISHLFVERTTRKLYSWSHKIDIVVNGKICFSDHFFLEIS